jgi:hypothetical protein
MFESIASEYGWPCQRLRLGIGLLLFTIFELSVAKQLPVMFVALLFAMGVASLISAALTLQDVKLRMQFGAVADAIADAKRSSTPLL